MQNTTPQSPASVKESSHRASITGGVLSIIALAMAGIGYGLIHAKYKADNTGADAVTKAGAAVSSTTGHVFSSIIGVPFLVGAIVISILAILLTVIRLRKVKASGLIFSVVWILVSVWSFRIAVAAFSVIKAHS